ncbi:hypothetical protein O181_011491 [Austropuccinia psidii MF-1]|uniref:Uncharacterized protein n=1 Tax=Austropuccinia psidii MF-1 TaxID=1389203 RepID=A0A9Q3GLD6_9BASI|nr:hypothetical protein [Austropuccinia psidii MF-1]
MIIIAKPQPEQSTQTAMTNSNNYFNYSQNVAISQVRDDAQRVIDQFANALHSLPTSNRTNTTASETAKLFSEIMHGVFSYQLDQKVEEESQLSDVKLLSMATSINDTLNSINNVVDELLSSTDGALKLGDLKKCLWNLVQQGGLHDGQTCVVVSSTSDQIRKVNLVCANAFYDSKASPLLEFRNVLQNFGDGIIPMDILQLTKTAVNPSFTSLIPGEEALFTTIENAIQSVQSSVSGELVQALDDAAKCFKQTVLAQVSFSERLKLTLQCNRDPNHSSVFRDLRTLYLSIINQFVGYVTPNVLEMVHQISDEYLKSGINSKPQEQFFRKAISDSVKSIVASNSGNQVTYSYKIADCLDTVVGVTDPETATNQAATFHCLEKPDGPLASLREILYGYIQQVYAVLPVEIAAQIEKAGLMRLDRSSPDYEKQVQHLHQEFLKTNPGPNYVTCYQSFLNCLFGSHSGGVLTASNNTRFACLLGDACRKSPDGKKNPEFHFY